MRLMAAESCESVEDFSARMLAAAVCWQDAVLGEFNQYTFEARPGMSTFDVRRAYEAAAYESYFGKTMPF